MTVENSETQAPESQGQESGDMVSIHDASVEDLDAALAAAQAQEGDPEEKAPSENPEAPSAPAEQPEEQAPPAGKPEAEAPNVAAQGADASKPRTYTEEEVRAIRADTERLKQKGDQKESFVQHRNSELTNYKNSIAANRTALQTRKAQLEGELEGKSAVDVVRDQKAIDAIERDLQQLDWNEQTAEQVVEAQTLFVRHIDTEKVSPDDIADVLRADGVSEQYIAKFKENPWLFTTPEALVQMGKRAEDRVGFKQADTDRRVLAKHVLWQNEEIKKLRARPGQVVGQIQRHLNAPPPVTSASGASPKAPMAMSDRTITRMGTQELDAALKQAQAQEGIH